MIAKIGIRTTALAAMAVALLASTASVADGQADRDSKEISNYVLTEATLAKYTQATHSLQRLLKNSAAACSDDSENAKSLDAMAAKVNAVPDAKTAMQAAGISAREYMVFSMSLLQNGIAAWALDQPGGKLSPGIQMANVKFIRAHDAALKKLGKETKTDNCDDDDRANESEE